MSACVCVCSHRPKGEHSSDPGLSEGQNQTHAPCPQNQGGQAEQWEPPGLRPPSPPGDDSGGPDHSAALCLDQDQLGSSVTIDMPNVHSAMELSTITGEREGLIVAPDWLIDLCIRDCIYQWCCSI
jgi:hypothetical protein